MTAATTPQQVTDLFLAALKAAGAVAPGQLTLTATQLAKATDMAVRWLLTPECSDCGDTADDQMTCEYCQVIGCRCVVDKDDDVSEYWLCTECRHEVELGLR